MLDEFNVGLGTPSTLSVQVTWGVKKLDRSKVGPWDNVGMGELIWDDEFTVAPSANQQALLDFCHFLRHESEIVSGS